MFCDESKSLGVKYEGSSRNQNLRPSPSTALQPTTAPISEPSYSRVESRLGPDHEQRKWIPSLILAPGTSAEDQATTFFFGNYVLGTELLNTCGNYQYLSTLHASEQFGPGLRQCVVAVGLAGLANFWKASNIMARSRRTYSSALRFVNTCLGDREEAKSDQTLAAIMLLGLYEVRAR